jgi:hypothetical protein
MTQAAQGEATAEKVPETIDDVTAMRRAMTRLMIAASAVSDDVREKINDAREAAQQAVEYLESNLYDADAAKSEAWDELLELREFLSDWEDADDKLIRVYRDIESGRTSEALHALDDVLSRVDSAWRTRA